MNTSLSTYLPVYASIDSSTTFNLVPSYTSINAWNSFVNNPVTYCSAFTYFPSTSKKIAAYSQLRDHVLTSAFVHVPIAIGKLITQK